VQSDCPEGGLFHYLCGVESPRRRRPWQVTSHVVLGGQPSPDLTFAYSKPQQIFYAGPPPTRLTQKMSLDAHVNLVFEQASTSQTKVTVNTAYSVRRDQLFSIPGAVPVSNSDTIRFHSGGSAAFPVQEDAIPSLCAATGALESELLLQVR
jgi:hypothetical protein